MLNNLIKLTTNFNQKFIDSFIVNPTSGKIYSHLDCIRAIAVICLKADYLEKNVLNGGVIIFSHYLNNALMALGFTLLIAGVEWGDNWVRLLFSFTYLRLIGLVGYSIYLLHMPLTYIIIKYPSITSLDIQQRFLVVFPILCTVVILMSIGFFIFIEKPFMLLKIK